MAALGSGFDCTSRREVKSVLALGVSPDHIIYANPCKAESHIKHAAIVGVNLTTFDSREELDKIRRWHPKCKHLIRLKAPDDGEARCPLGPKYGALPEEVVPLLQAANDAQLAVVGVSFHVGSGVMRSQAFNGAIAAAKAVFNAADRLGMPHFQILNIGGGFTAGAQFDEASGAVNSALLQHFADKPSLKVIAEPGRFFAETAFTLAANIIGKRVRKELREYWINDGIYSSMNCILYDHASVMALPLACSSVRIQHARGRKGTHLQCLAPCVMHLTRSSPGTSFQNYMPMTGLCFPTWGHTQHLLGPTSTGSPPLLYAPTWLTPAHSNMNEVILFVKPSVCNPCSSG